MFDYENSPEKELIRRAKKGDVKAFSSLYARIYIELYKFALYTTKHEQDAEDAVSEAVITAFEKMAQLKRDESFRSWMFTILCNQCRRILRERKKSGDPMEEMENHTGSTSSGSAENPDYTSAYAVKEAFGALEEEERMIVAFSVFGGYRSEEIGTMLEKNPATVRSKKSRALEKMRRVLDV